MNIKDIYNQAFDHFNSDRILFRGFLLEKELDGTILFKDIRSPYYKDINRHDLEVFFDMGFLKGTTYLLMESDKRKVSRYKELKQHKTRLLEITDNPRKYKEHLNTISRYESEINYYKSQVSRWQEFIKHN